MRSHSPLSITCFATALAACSGTTTSDEAAMLSGGQSNGTGGSVASGGSSGAVLSAGGSGAVSGGAANGATNGDAGSTSGGAGSTSSGGDSANSDAGSANSGAGSASSGAGSTSSGGDSANGGGNAKGGAAGADGGASGTPAIPPLDCGEEGWAVENHGPPKNRVNYLILADGYDATTVNTTLVEHIETMLQRRFEHESGQPYARYRNFVNICVMKAVSENDGIGNGPTIFGGGNGGDRLAAVDNAKVNAYIKSHVPASFEIDWKAVVLNQNRWENTGAALMLWSGAHPDAAGAALHEGGHGFHQLADEYCATATGASCGADSKGSGSSGMEYQEVNSTGDPATTGGKWDLWLGSTQKGLNVPDRGATGVQGTFVGSRYVDTGQYRPSANSMMNSLFGLDVNTSFNSVSREQIVFSIWRAVVPIDSTDPPAGEVMNPSTLRVNVIDPAVINVDWTVDGAVSDNGGTSFDTASLASGTHTISARAYDNASMDLVRNRSGKCPPSATGGYCHGSAWPRSQQTVTWTVIKP